MKSILLLIAVCVISFSAGAQTVQYESKRPSPEERLFVSKAVEARINEVTQMLTNDKLRWMFTNCFPNTLDTTVHPNGEIGRAHV